MMRAEFQAAKQALEFMPWKSGDAMIFKTFWDVLNLGPTDPGVSQPCLLDSGGKA